MNKLTKRMVDSAVARSSPYFLWCGALSGFGVRVFPSGRKIYYADFRTAAGTRRRMAIGQHGKLTTDEARRQASITLGEVLRGIDPVDERATRRRSLTVDALCALYLAAAHRGLILGQRGLPKKPTTLATDRGRIERHIRPLLGRKLVRDVTTVDVARFMRDVASGKTAIVVKTEKPRGKAVVKGGLGTAARTVGLLGGIFSYAMSEGVIDLNPVRGVRRSRSNHRQRRLTPEEYRRLGKVLLGLGPEQSPAIVGAWLLALTGCRLGEVTNLRWDEVDFERRLLRFNESKTGPSLRPLGKAPLEILKTQRRRSNSPYVLAAPSGQGQYKALPKAWHRIAARAGLVGVTPHSMRHSFASVANDLGFALPTIGAMLGHSAGTVTGGYVHQLDDVLVEATSRVAEEIDRLMRG